LKGNQRATSTVTGIIDGTGTLGSAAGQFIIGVTQAQWGWQNGYLLVVAIVTSATIIPIVGIAIKEVKEVFRIR
jgi:OPA family glycerol-3-phosphate transporter-like MFS transporter 3